MQNEPTTPLIMIYSHWVAAGAVRETITAELRGEEVAAERLGSDVAKGAKTLSAFYRMLVFYALLYVVVEAYRSQDTASRDPVLDKFLDDPHTDKLRRLRNAVFHVQGEPLNPKLWEFLLMPESENWVKTLNSKFEQYFRAKLPIDTYLQALASRADKERE